MRILAGIALSTLIIGCAGPAERLTARGTAGLDYVVTEVDSEMARYYLEDYRQNYSQNDSQDDRQGSRQDLREATGRDREIDEILVPYEKQALTTDSLVQLANVTSNDFAAVYFARRITRENFALKKTFLEYSEKPGRRFTNSPYTIVFVPGLFYESKPESKGDLRDAETIVRGLGLATDRIATDEAGTVEINAAIVADYLRAYPDDGRPIVLVSASKGGPEVLHALGNLLSHEESRSVHAWVSIGGVLRGSQIADRQLVFPASVPGRLAAWWMGFDFDLVRSLSTDSSRDRLVQAELPEHLTVLHYVGVPLSGTVSKPVRSPYEKMAAFGPSDGLTLLTDQLLPGERVLTDLGLDHRFAHPRIAEKTAALALTMLDLLQCSPAGTGRSVEPCNG